ncbi:MAG: hypothetical protein CVV49_21975 [Spirochaetae bacterium HGW-Spirochaetae-5]|nr:MAG: hypothetical protein CVV49_21975 [Spirochaetae bacterium HGW-Spirochaetae-5]
MKISNLNADLRWNNQNGKTSRGSEIMPEHNPAYRKASGGEDFLEISDEALKRHKEAKILSFEEGRRKKEADNNRSLTENTNLSAAAKSDRIKDMIAGNRYDFNNNDILAETADMVLTFLG